MNFRGANHGACARNIHYSSSAARPRVISSSPPSWPAKFIHSAANPVTGLYRARRGIKSRFSSECRAVAAASNFSDFSTLSPSLSLSFCASASTMRKICHPDEFPRSTLFINANISTRIMTFRIRRKAESSRVYIGP